MQTDLFAMWNFVFCFVCFVLERTVQIFWPHDVCISRMKSKCVRSYPCGSFTSEGSGGQRGGQSELCSQRELTAGMRREGCPARTEGIRVWTKVSQGLRVEMDRHIERDWEGLIESF